MKKYIYLFPFLAVILAVSCKKDKSGPEVVDSRPPQEVITALTEELAAADSISSFTNALKSITLSKEETAQGLTVFAPLNDNSTANVSAVKAKSDVPKIKEDTSDPAEIALKDHIVKGIYKPADLTDGKVMSSLSGKNLKITRSGDSIWVNGVFISGAGITSGSKEAVYVVQKPLSNTTIDDEPAVTGSIEITVWNALLWVPDKPSGAAAADADVVLYRSQQDYADSQPAYQGKTNADGKVIFQNVPAGTYYIEVSKDNISNIFYKSNQPQDGVYKGLAAAGIIQSMNEIDNMPVQSGDALPGNFKWKDINSDGVINNSDFTALPHESAKSESGKNVQVSVLIGYVNNYTMGPVKTESQALELLGNVETAVSAWHKEVVMLDGVLSDDAGAAASNYQSIDSFNFLSSDPVITQVWLKAYQYISGINKLISEIENAAINNKALVTARAKALRAYIYLQLSAYFGNIPLQTGAILETNASNDMAASEVYTFIKSDIQAAVSGLPNSSGNVKQLDAVSIKALSAKAALYNKDYAAAYLEASSLINSGRYQLASQTSNIFTANSTETIWDNSGSLSPLFKNYFDNRDICPYFRLGEMYLIAAESALETNKPNEALEYLNLLRQSRGMNTITSGQTIDNLRKAVQDTWKIEMQKEGGRFVNLVRWNAAMDILGSKGFTPKHVLLPIPMVILDQYPNISQNSGY